MEFTLADLKLAIAQAEMHGAASIALHKYAGHSNNRHMDFDFRDSASGADVTVRLYEADQAGTTRSPELIEIAEEA